MFTGAEWIFKCHGSPSFWCYEFDSKIKMSGQTIPLFRYLNSLGVTDRDGYLAQATLVISACSVSLEKWRGSLVNVK